MVFCLGVLCLVLGAAAAALLVKIHLMRRSAEQLRRQLAQRLETDTNTLLSLPSRDRAMRALAEDLNGQLRLLRRQRQRYQQGDQELKDAVTGVSHDLRTPLTAICGYLDLLEREELSPGPRRYTALIRGRTERLRELTEELFRYSLVLSSPELTPAPVDLGQALEESLAAYYGVLTQGGITPEVHMAEEPVVRELDAGALSRIFANILSNAVKYSAGDLSITLTPTGAVTFSNTAPGMTPVLAQKLFDRFFTVETGRSATGLGLTIARHLTEAMGGTISTCCREGTLEIALFFPKSR